METKIAAAETQAPAARMNFFVGVYLVLLFTNVCLFIQVYLDLLFTNAGQSWSKLVHHDRGYWSDKHDETGQDAPNLNKKMCRMYQDVSGYSQPEHDNVEDVSGCIRVYQDVSGCSQPEQENEEMLILLIKILTNEILPFPAPSK